MLLLPPCLQLKNRGTAGVRMTIETYTVFRAAVWLTCGILRDKNKGMKVNKSATGFSPAMLPVSASAGITLSKTL